MAENTDIEHNDTSTDSESVNPIKEIITNNESENMEVHHHPDLHHKPKPWKEYFLEFIMIFLAVTLGFFAENLREHFADNKKGNEYAISMKEDLIKDTVFINAIIQILQKDISGCDSLIKHIQTGNIKTVSDLNSMYTYNLMALGGFTFGLTDRTSSQLKNSGGMRFITNKKVSDGILNYWQNGEVIDGIQSGLSTMRQQAREKTYLIFDNKYYAENSDTKGFRAVSADARLLTDNFNQLAELSNRLSHFKNTIRGPYIKALNKQKSAAIDLISLIEKEYE
jgi:hypothetical protein